ncbi:major facilitator family transporter [Listeria grandensis FSL F6-0971]|uniref:Major facilitator family transporter n=1 Tax=Listeria grandensis FSL F6-0971 TaxID=1265819 RepID=W7BI74_9LIST|nr:MFS transporter [Listeria grandensis]EUJ22936.1 major facilitator family transporter [Listeria grandensis FSL F6-0971]
MEKTQQRKGILPILFLGYIAIYIDKLVIGVIAVPLAEQLNLSLDEKSYIFSAFFIGYSIMQIPFGYLNDKLGSKFVLIISLSIITIASIVFGSASTLIALVAARFFAGIGHAGYPTSSARTVTDTYPMEKRTWAQSILISTSGIASIIGPLLIPIVIGAFGWRGAVFCIAFLFVLALILVIWKLPNMHKEKQQSSAPKQKASMPFWKVLTNPVVVLLFIAMCSINIVLYTIANWTPTYLADERGVSLIMISVIVAIAGLGSLLGSFGTAYIVGRYFQHREKRVIFVLSIITAGAALLVYSSESIAVLTFWLFLCYMCSVMIFSTMFTLPLKRLHESIVGTATGVVNTGATLGGVFAPMIVAQLVGTFGSYQTVFIAIAVAATFTCVIVAFLPNMKQTVKA